MVNSEIEAVIVRVLELDEAAAEKERDAALAEVLQLKREIAEEMGC